MKKLLLIASALLAFSFFGCEQPSNSTTSDTGKSDVVVDSGDDANKDDDTTGDDTTGEEDTKPTELVIFDPATYDGDTVEINGEKFVKITVDGFNTWFDINEVDCSGYNKIIAKMCAPEYHDDKQCYLGVYTSDWGNVAPGLAMLPIPSTPTDVEAEIAPDYTTVSRIQPMVQSTTDWSGVSGVVVYIGKITAKL